MVKKEDGGTMDSEKSELMVQREKEAKEEDEETGHNKRVSLEQK